MQELGSVAVFCGSSTSALAAHLDLAARVGAALAANGIRLVYGGGDTGLMGAVARATMQGGGAVTGVIPGGLFSNGIDGEAVSQLEVVESMHERKARMYELADAFLALPGGIGTFEELFEAATWTQLGLHQAHKPVVLLAEDDFWAPAFALLDRATADGLVRESTRSIVTQAGSIEQAFDALAGR